MKLITTTLAGFAFATMMLPVHAETTTEKTTDVTKNSDGSVTKTETKTTTFNPEARTKVVKYFDTYKTERHGLPPAWAAKVRVKEVPAIWRTPIAPGLIVSEKERSYLVDAPDDLVTVLPPSSNGVRYYIAGSNVVAVDANYRVVDVVNIPSITLTVD